MRVSCIIMLLALLLQVPAHGQQQLDIQGVGHGYLISPPDAPHLTHQYTDRASVEHFHRPILLHPHQHPEHDHLRLHEESLFESNRLYGPAIEQRPIEHFGSMESHQSNDGENNNIVKELNTGPNTEVKSSVSSDRSIAFKKDYLTVENKLKVKTTPDAKQKQIKVPNNSINGDYLNSLSSTSASKEDLSRSSAEKHPLKFIFPIEDEQANILGTLTNVNRVNKTNNLNIEGRTSSDTGIGPQRGVEDTIVDCQKMFMRITFKFSSPFSGWIYPYNHFHECLLFAGSNHRRAELTLHHGVCGQQHRQLTGDGDALVNPVFEHHLMVQWEPEFVSEDDSSVVVRCDRPDDYNKTVSWTLGAGDLQATVERGTHPGPRMWMDIEKGEGPSAPSLSGEVVRVGDILTLVFRLADDVFWFDSNILSCYAFDGTEEKRRIEWEGTGGARPRHTYSGQMLVIENGCSTKPKIFSHFLKQRETTPDGTKISMHYAYFKAFRFPTSLKVQIECDVEVCYQDCPELQPCNLGFQPRAAAGHRQRRAAEEEGEQRDHAEAHELDRVNFRKTIEVHMREADAQEQGSRARVTSSAEELGLACYPPNVFFGTVITLGVSVVLLAMLLICCTFQNSRRVRPTFLSPK